VISLQIAVVQRWPRAHLLDQVRLFFACNGWSTVLAFCSGLAASAAAALWQVNTGERRAEIVQRPVTKHRRVPGHPGVCRDKRRPVSDAGGIVNAT
jgi:hypothetical protein